MKPAWKASSSKGKIVRVPCKGAKRGNLAVNNGDGSKENALCFDCSCGTDYYLLLRIHALRTASRCSITSCISRSR